jgi:AcrR family transcriptional regulator
VTKAEPRGRREKALETRRRVLRAAYDLFCAHGYASTTMELIAERAGVAVQTLYFTFHTKAAIAEETFGAAILGFDLWDPRAAPAVSEDGAKALAEFHPWYAAFTKAPSQRTALDIYVDASADILARVSPLLTVLAAAAASDAQLKAQAELGERRRVEAFAFVVDLLAKRGKLRAGVSTRRATDVMLTILSGETYAHLAARKWSHADAKRWLRDVLADQILAPARR